MNQSDLDRSQHAVDLDDLASVWSGTLVDPPTSPTDSDHGSVVDLEQHRTAIAPPEWDFDVDVDGGYVWCGALDATGVSSADRGSPTASERDCTGDCACDGADDPEFEPPFDPDAPGPCCSSVLVIGTNDESPRFEMHV